MLLLQLKMVIIIIWIIRRVRIIIDIYKKSLVLLSVICLVVLTACSSKEVSQSSEVKSVDNKAAVAEGTRVGQTVNGEVEIPANPQWIVTQSGLLATLLESKGEV